MIIRLVIAGAYIQALFNVRLVIGNLITGRGLKVGGLY